MTELGSQRVTDFDFDRSSAVKVNPTTKFYCHFKPLSLVNNLHKKQNFVSVVGGSNTAKGGSQSRRLDKKQARTQVSSLNTSQTQMQGNVALYQQQNHHIGRRNKASLLAKSLLGPTLVIKTVQANSKKKRQRFNEDLEQELGRIKLKQNKTSKSRQQQQSQHSSNQTFTGNMESCERKVAPSAKKSRFFFQGHIASR